MNEETVKIAKTIAATLTKKEAQCYLALSIDRMRVCMEKNDA